MAKPRVFVSSTYYDLKYVRSSLELFISSLGFDPVLFEHGGVAFAPDKALMNHVTVKFKTATFSY